MFNPINSSLHSESTSGNLFLKLLYLFWKNVLEKKKNCQFNLYKKFEKFRFMKENSKMF